MKITKRDQRKKNKSLLCQIQRYTRQTRNSNLGQRFILGFRFSRWGYFSLGNTASRNESTVELEESTPATPAPPLTDREHNSTTAGVLPSWGDAGSDESLAAIGQLIHFVGPFGLGEPVGMPLGLLLKPNLGKKETRGNASRFPITTHPPTRTTPPCTVPVVRHPECSLTARLQGRREMKKRTFAGGCATTGTATRLTPQPTPSPTRRESVKMLLLYLCWISISHAALFVNITAFPSFGSACPIVSWQS